MNILWKGFLYKWNKLWGCRKNFVNNKMLRGGKTKRAVKVIDSTIIAWVWNFVALFEWTLMEQKRQMKKFETKKRSLGSFHSFLQNLSGFFSTSKSNVAGREVNITVKIVHLWSRNPGLKTIGMRHLLTLENWHWRHSWWPFGENERRRERGEEIAN